VTAYVPGPPELLPGRPDAVVDLQTDEGVSLVGGQWRYVDTAVREVDFVGVGPDLGPSGPANRTYDVLPHAGGTDLDDQGWRPLAPADTRLRLGNGRVSFNWYRLAVTLPDRLGDLDPTGCTVVFECVVDDAAEIWVDGRLPVALGQSGGQVAAGFNAPNRVVLTRDARPGQRFQLAVFGINGPISASPANYIWIRSATLDVYRPQHAAVTEQVDLRVERLDPRLDALLPEGAAAERVATGFAFTEGPAWTVDGALLFSSPNTNTIYRWTPSGAVSVFRTKSGYTGVDIGRYVQPGSNGLAFDPDGRLTICQHGNRQVLRVEPHGNTTVLADAFDGRRLNSPNDLVYGSDGTLYFTDPPFGLPDGEADAKKELPFSGVFAVAESRIRVVTDELRGPNGIALSPDERHLYVGNWDPERKVVMRYDTGVGARGAGDLVCDLTGEPGEDAIDGLEVDRAGNVYACGPGGIWILSPDGDRLGLIGLPESPHNLAWGDVDRRALYVTAVTSVYRIRMGIGGRSSAAGKDHP
jgi:gluconolactonase